MYRDGTVRGLEFRNVLVFEGVSGCPSMTVSICIRRKLVLVHSAHYFTDTEGKPGADTLIVHASKKGLWYGRWSTQMLCLDSPSSVLMPSFMICGLAEPTMSVN